MKTLELKLKKDVLIVDTIDFILTEEMINNKVDNIILADYEFLCKGSGLTEEIASELVEYWQKRTWRNPCSMLAGHRSEPCFSTNAITRLYGSRKSTNLTNQHLSLLFSL
jgi:hypothetical protein